MRIAADTISLVEIANGVRAFAKHEPRDAMYKVASRLIESSWGTYEDVSDALGVLLLTWNQAFYRYGPLDFDAVQTALDGRSAEILSFRTVEILTVGLETDDQDAIRDLFAAMLDACSIITTKSKELRKTQFEQQRPCICWLLRPSRFGTTGSQKPWGSAEGGQISREPAMWSWYFGVATSQTRSRSLTDQFRNLAAFQVSRNRS